MFAFLATYDISAFILRTLPNPVCFSRLIVMGLLMTCLPLPTSAAEVKGKMSNSGSKNKVYKLSIVSNDDLAVHASVQGTIEIANEVLAFHIDKLTMRAKQDIEICGLAMAGSGKDPSGWKILVWGPPQSKFLRMVGGEVQQLERLTFTLPARPLVPQSKEVWPTFVMLTVIQGKCAGYMFSHGKAGTLKDLINSAEANSGVQEKGK